jgi:ATP-binding cassette, subfamily B, bacterial
MPSSSASRRRGASVESPTLRERIAVFRHVPPFVKLVWQTHQSLTIAMIILRLARAFVPIAVLWVGKLIIDAVVAARGGTLDSKLLWRLVALEIALAITGEMLSRASSVVESLLGDLFSNRTSVLLMQHAATLDLYQFEDPAFYDQLDRARRQTTGRIGLLALLLSMGQDASWLWYPAFSAKHTTPRWNIRCSSAGRRSDDSSTTCDIWAPAIVQRRKSRCLDLRPG